MDYSGQRIYYCGKNAQQLTVSFDSNSEKLFYTAKKSNSKKSKRNPYLSKRLKKFESQKIELLPLREICVNFVVDNFHLTDSLLGLPELIGEELFKKCIEIGYFEIDSAGNWREVLDIFIEAYSELILESLCLSGQWLFLAVDLEYILPFISLKEVDFSFCKIGDSHEVLTHLGSLNNLEVLNLSQNQISTAGVKNLTMNSRRKKNGLEKLKQLRLDGNNLTDNSFLPFLQDLSDLNVIVVDCNLKSDKTSTKLHKFSVCPYSIRFHGNVFKTLNTEGLGTGWAIPLILDHVKKLNQRLSKQKENLKEKTEEIKNKFYNNKSKPGASQNTTVSNAVEKHAKNHVILCKCAFNNPHKQTSKVENKPVLLPAKKRLLSPSAWNSKTKRLNRDHSTELLAKEAVSIDKSILDLYS